MSSWRWQLMHRLPAPASGRLSLWQRSHARLSCMPLSEKSPTSWSGFAASQVRVVWHCAQPVPYWPLWTAGSGWQPKQSVGRGLNVTDGWQSEHRVVRCLPSSRNADIVLWLKMLSPVSTWHCSHLSPSRPLCASSHLFFLCSPLSGNASTLPLASLGNGWSWSNLSASHTPDEWHAMHLSPSVVLCSESSWHWPAALQFGLSPENDVLPLLSRPVWQVAHGTGLLG